MCGLDVVPLAISCAITHKMSWRSVAPRIGGEIGDFLYCVALSALGKDTEDSSVPFKSVVGVLDRLLVPFQCSCWGYMFASINIEDVCCDMKNLATTSSNSQVLVTSKIAKYVILPRLLSIKLH